MCPPSSSISSAQRSHQQRVFLLSTALLVFFCACQNTHATEADVDVHDALFTENKYPSAHTCKTCHPVQFKEWSVSPHAYGQISPVFNAMQARINKLTNGTQGDFCIRCHTPVGMMLGEGEYISNMDRHPVSVEGVTCVACHRLSESSGKISSRFGLIEGDIFEPVYGPNGNQELRRVIDSGEFDVNTQRGKAGRAIHTDAKKKRQIVTSGVCGACHDVNLITGFRLEEAFSDYKTSPAAAKGISCQDCHMGKEPGINAGYDIIPVAVVGGKTTKPRKHANHTFIGPDYSIVHPAIFPHNTAAREMASLREWTQFNYQAGWGTDRFEDTAPKGETFPDRWKEASQRYEARALIDDNLQLLKAAHEQRKTLLQRGYQLGDIRVRKADARGIAFSVEFKNATEGHSVPTGFDAERPVFLRVTVTDQHGKVVFKSGDLDPNGDLRDGHSIYVHNGEIPEDTYLFSLQSKFIVNMLRGGEREQILAVNYSADPLPFIRPSTVSTILLGRPTGARKHRQVLAPLSSKWPTYKVTKSELAGSEGPYRAHIQIIAGMVPVNLVYEIQDVGFDFGMSPREIANNIVAGHQVLAERDLVLSKGRFTHDRPSEVGRPHEHEEPSEAN